MKYASGTTITPQRTMEDISRLLKKEGVRSILWIDGEEKIGCEFVMHERRLRFVCVLPTRYTTGLDKSARRMGAVQAEQAHQRLIREHWRGLLLVIKAKIESVTIGIETIEEAFMPQLVMADNRTMAEIVLPQIQSGQLALLPGGK